MQRNTRQDWKVSKSSYFNKHNELHIPMGVFTFNSVPLKVYPITQKHFGPPLSRTALRAWSTFLKCLNIWGRIWVSHSQLSFTATARESHLDPQIIAATIRYWDWYFYVYNKMCLKTQEGCECGHVNVYGFFPMVPLTKIQNFSMWLFWELNMYHMCICQID